MFDWPLNSRFKDPSRSTINNNGRLYVYIDNFLVHNSPFAFFCECTCHFFITVKGSNHYVEFILQLAKTGHPGLFKLWAMIGNDLHAIKVAVPRIFYVNQKTPKEGEGASKCLRKLLSSCDLTGTV